jgi:hypothetical protein
MTNAGNATTIVKKLLEFAKKSLDSHMRRELVENITSLAEQYTPNIFWYIDTMNTLFEIGPEYVPPSAIQNMMSVISLGVGDDDDKDEEMRKYCVDTFFEILDTKSVVHDLHLQVISWVLGEYGYMSGQYSQNDILDLLCDVADRQLEQEETRAWVISAMMKLVAHTGGIVPASVEAVLHKYKNSKNVDLQQRCYEFLSLVNCCTDSNREQIFDTILPIDGSCIDIEVDDQLSFLQDYVEAALDRGSAPYVPHNERHELEERATKKSSQLKFKEYEKPVVPKTNLHEVFVPKENRPDELSQRTDEKDHPEHSYYPSSYTTETALNPHLLQNKARIWADDDEPAQLPATNNQPYGDSTQKYSPEPVRSRADSFDNAPLYSLSKQDRPVDEPPKKSGKNAKLMKDLFGGVGDSGGAYVKKGSGAAKKKPSVRTTTKKTSSRTQEVEFEEPQAPKQDDFWGGMNVRSEEPQPPVTTSTIRTGAPKQPVVQAPKQELLSFDEFFGEAPSPSVDTQQKRQSTTPQQRNIPSTDDFFMDSPSHDNGPSAFDNLMNPSPKNTKSPVQSNVPLIPSRPQVNLLDELAQEAKKATEAVTLARDDLLEVIGEKYWRNDTVVIALQFRNNRGFTLTTLNCQFQPPSKFNMRYQFDTSYNQPIVRGNSVTFPKVEHGLPVVLLIELQLADVVGFGTSIMGTINYTDQNKKNKILSVTSTIDLLDLLRPVDMPVNDFGQQWVAYTHEKKMNTKGVFTLQSYSERAESQLNIKVLQTIRSEAVGVARVISHGVDLLCLVHAKISPQGLALSVKSKDKSVCEHFCRIAQKVLSQ